MNKKKNNLFDISVLFLCGLIPVLISNFFTNEPQHRYIHIENFRYGKNPSVIRCSRGDTLHLSFSSRDTGHSFFLEEFDIDVKVSPGSDRVLVFRTSDPSQPPAVKNEVVIVAEHPGIYNYLISKSYYRCHVWCGPMHAFEHGILIIRPNTLLYFGLGLLLGLFVIGMKRINNLFTNALTDLKKYKNEKGIDIFAKFPWTKNLLKKSWLQPVFMSIGALFLYIVILTTLFGTQMSGRNLGVMLIWIVWLFLIICIFTPFGGRIWCLACPLPMFGEFLQRRAITRVREGSTSGYRNKFFGLNLSWPGWLKSGWVRLILFLITATLSTTFVANPHATGTVIVILVVITTIMALIFKLRSFCLYICPINAFIGLYSKLGKLALRKSDPSVCAKCKPVFCQKGSNNGWACPYGLNVAEIEDNFDCGLCTQCLRSCLYDNVTLYWRKFASETIICKTSLAWTAMVLFVISAVYTVVYLGHWPVVRDYVNILDKGNWDLFGIYTLILWGSSLFIFPLCMLLTAKISKLFSGVSHKTFDLMRASTGALLPFSLFIWIAFILQMLFTNVSFVGQSLSDPFGWGWNLIGLAATPWKQFIPRFVPWIQVMCVLIGFIYSFRNLFRIWLDITAVKKSIIRGMLPQALFLWITACSFIWFYAN